MASNYTLTNTTLDYNNQSGINFTMLCPIYSESDHFWKETIAFWLDGVIKTVVAIFGILTNILAAYILMKPKMKSSFNLSLVALNVIDSIFLLGSVLESFKLRFGVSTQIQKILYPQLIHPLNHIVLTGSILMIVALTIERYCAVHYPGDFRESSLQPMLMHKRMCRYVGPVVFLAILLNITKFFEAYIVHTEKGEISLRVSSMRKDPLYSAISKWTRLFILGLFPFCIILYLNFKIYMKLSQRATDRRSIYENGRLPTTIGDQVCIMGNHVSRGTAMSTNDHEMQTLDEISLKSISAKSPHSGKFNDSNKPRIKTKFRPKGSLVKISGHNQKLRRTEDRRAKIFLFITVIFITCHIPRLILDIHELINLKIAIMCQNAKIREITPAWTFIMIYVSHFCLVSNATFNMFIYGFMSQEFQRELKTVMNEFLCCFRSSVVIV